MNRIRISVCYLITTLLISIFVYCLIFNNIQNAKKLERLKEEVDEIAHLILQAPLNYKNEPKHITDLIDNLIKKRLAGIWDDLYSIKKQLKGRDCSSIVEAAKSFVRQEGALAKTEERVNYAAKELGATIFNVKAEPINPPNFLNSWLGIEFPTNPPINALKSSMVAGNCFGYKGTQAEITVKLANEIFIDQFVIQHITKKQTPTEDISSAPKDFKVYGIFDEKNFPLGTFKFDNSPKDLLQRFNIRSNGRIRHLRFEFYTNHGHPNYTCIYRIAVYGKL